MRERYVQLLQELGSQRDLFWIAAEAALVLAGSGFTGSLQAVATGGGASPLVISRFVEGRREDRVLALTGPHARWLEWF